LEQCLRGPKVEVILARSYFGYSSRYLPALDQLVESIGRNANCTTDTDGFDLSMENPLSQRARFDNSIQVIDGIWDTQQPPLALTRSALVPHCSNLSKKKSNAD